MVVATGTAILVSENVAGVTPVAEADTLNVPAAELAFIAGAVATPFVSVFTTALDAPAKVTETPLIAAPLVPFTTAVTRPEYAVFTVAVMPLPAAAVMLAGTGVGVGVPDPGVQPNTSFVSSVPSGRTPHIGAGHPLSSAPIS